MSKKKSNKQQTKVFSPEEYIRTRARKLPIYKCYKAINSFEDREMVIIVARQHPQGEFTFAAFMLDKWCLGVKDAMWRFYESPSELEYILTLFRNKLKSLEEIDYVEAHNWVYGALDFAEEAGIKPCKDFAISKFILEEDDDDVELREYDFGRDGEYCLVAKDMQEASRYTPTLDKVLGKGNYQVEIGTFDSDNDKNWDDDWDDEKDWQDDEESWLDNEEPRRLFEPTPSMEYTYEGKCYPQEISLNFPEIEAIAGKDTEKISDKEMKRVLTLSPELARADLQNLIWRELGKQWGKSVDDLNDENSDYNWWVVGNAMMFLTHFGTTEDTLPVVLEVMRQNHIFQDFNFGDISEILLYPVLCNLIKDNPRLLKPYLLEPGLGWHFKNMAFELLEHIAYHKPDVRQEIIDMTVEVLAEYKNDLPNRTICDGNVVAFAIGVLISAGAKEHLPLIEELYATNMVDEGIEGHIDEVRRTIKHPYVCFQLPPSDPYGVRTEYRKFVKMA